MKTTTTRVRPRATLTALMIAVTALLAMPATAWGHAQLIGSTPGRGETVPTTPELIELEFNEPVEASFGALRLHDSEGRALETGPIERPGGRREVVAIRPAAELAEGAYTLTFRIVSADSHPVAGGFIFSVGESEAPTLTVADLLAEEGGSGRVTEILFAASRVLAYAALRHALVMARVGQRQVHFGEVEPKDDPEEMIMHISTLRAMVEGTYWDSLSPELR